MTTLKTAAALALVDAAAATAIGAVLAVTALVFVIRHRITVQRLILKGRVAHDDSRATNITSIA